MLSCYIVEDDLDSIEILEDYIEKSLNLVSLGHETDPRKTLELFTSSENLPDVTFLDIELPNISGIDLARIIKDKTLIVFATGYNNFGTEAFELGAIDYLKKPFSYERFLLTLSKIHQYFATKELNEKTKHIFLHIKENKKTLKVKVNLEDIIRIQGLGNYLQIFTHSERNYIYYGKLSDIQFVLPRDFVRTHRSHIVNLKYVEIIDGNNVVLRNGVSIPIGEKFKQNLG
ncbi:LytTR family DNA-binding domain-containing protein [Olivibacter sp. CPCC 100613]|uniref:LytR/AlgR family response regulator transcription factor n=1 Tax=Olivibacter sp. CPCC 100613 TaxID=3079931 RepID=UPI002FF96EC1